MSLMAVAYDFLSFFDGTIPEVQKPDVKDILAQLSFRLPKNGHGVFSGGFHGS